MSKYRKVDPRIWNDAKFRDLSDNAKLVFFMLLTHPNMTSIGAMRATIAGLAEEMNWTQEAFREAFREGLVKGLLEHDQKACFVGLPNFIKYNAPESPNVVKAWVSALDLLPECDLKDSLIHRVKAFLKAFNEAFLKAFDEAFDKTSPKTKAIQKQEQKQKQNKKKGAGKKFSSEDCPLPDFISRNLWQAWCKDRAERKKPVTQAAAEAQIEKLSAWQNAGYDAEQAIKDSIANGWQGLFEPKFKRAASGARAVAV